MNYKFFRISGIILTAIGVISIPVAVILWFLNYLAMQEGYYELGTPIMNTFGVFCCTSLLIYIGPILLIVSAIMHSNNMQNNQTTPLQSSQPTPAIKKIAPQNAPPTQAVQPHQKRCPKCSAINNISSNFCMICGHKFL